MTLAAAQAAQVQSESTAIAHGLKRQNPELLDELIELYQHRLLRYLLFLTGKREVAEDLFQETWMRVLLRGGQYNGKARFDTWLFTIARNLVIDLSRKRTMASLDEMSEGERMNAPLRSPYPRRLRWSSFNPAKIALRWARFCSNWNRRTGRFWFFVFTRSFLWKRSLR